jgi:hypothetical protein
LSWVDYTTHELPYGYLGSASDDLEALARADMLLSDLRDEESRVAYAAIVAEERAAIAGYLAHSAMQDRGESEE